MLKPEERFFAPSGNIYPGGPITWHVMDWYQRRLISVTIEEEEVESAEPVIEHLWKHIYDLAPEVFEVRVSKQGDLISTSTDPEDDITFCPFYPSLDLIQRPDGIQAISRSDLEELDRLGPLVDLVRCLKPPEPSKKLVFKIVVDEIQGWCVGFTTAHIPHGTLEENKARVFKLKWLHQLIAVIDELNLSLGIAHQDVAPRNLLIDDTTDSLMIFDFNFSVRIGEIGYSEALNGIKGVMFTMYEIITRDVTPREVEHEEQNVLNVEKNEWIPHPDVQLDHPVSEFRETLAQWSKRRQQGKHITSYKDAPSFIHWPNTPEPSPSEVVLNYSSGPVTHLKVLWSVERRRMLEQGKTVLNWQRSAQAKLKPGDRILETGEFIQMA